MEYSATDNSPVLFLTLSSRALLATSTEANIPLQYFLTTCHTVHVSMVKGISLLLSMNVDNECLIDKLGFYMLKKEYAFIEYSRK